MPVGKVTYHEPGAVAHPSPRIWADCPCDGSNTDVGIFFHENFLGGMTASAVTDGSAVGQYFTVDCDTDTVFAFKASEEGGYLDIETDSDDEDAVAIFTQPMCKIAIDSGRRVWLEARLEVGDADEDQGFFFGLAEEAALSRDIVADNCVDLITETLIGYRIFDEEDAIDAVAQLDDGAEDVIASDVTNLDVLDADLGSGSKAALADNTEMRLGLRFDGKKTVTFFVNGVEIEAWTLDATYYDPDASLAVICALKTCDDSTAKSIAIDWIQFAYEYHL